ncbi:ribonuclease pancreatic isoform X1 [Saimiri boliviensis]|uniref:ribonuclease pancreatic isoform X1 n=1 Tax=Saimiri boliviensis TaxID=27679 RepID=UPI00193E8F7E|nr:ribonuclease pancreatic isoform X1 [Saimiri boliviensis boliviensis]XP_039324846.1 ribonuclease pancreatic isoform X1 [Saimiri boliviensis boliviensis]
MVWAWGISAVMERHIQGGDWRGQFVGQGLALGCWLPGKTTEELRHDSQAWGHGHLERPSRDWCGPVKHRAFVPNKFGGPYEDFILPLGKGSLITSHKEIHPAASLWWPQEKGIGTYPVMNKPGLSNRGEKACNTTVTRARDAPPTLFLSEAKPLCNLYKVHTSAAE